MVATLARAGCIAVGQAGAPVADALVLKRGLEYAATFDLPVMFRPQDAALAAGGCAHEGPVATRLGLPGIPAVAESVELARDLLLVEATGVRAHFQQISSRESLPLLRAAKARGLPVTADVSVHHLLLDESALEGFNSHCHVIPPLRGAAAPLKIGAACPPLEKKIEFFSVLDVFKISESCGVFRAFLSEFLRKVCPA